MVYAGRQGTGTPVVRDFANEVDRLQATLRMNSRRASAGIVRIKSDSRRSRDGPYVPSASGMRYGTNEDREGQEVDTGRLRDDDGRHGLVLGAMTEANENSGMETIFGTGVSGFSDLAETKLRVVWQWFSKQARLL